MNILVVDCYRTLADHVSDLLYRDGHNPLPLYSLQDALEQTDALAAPFQPGKFFFDVAILCTINPLVETTRFADSLRELMPWFKVVVLDFPEELEFLRSLRSDFSYLALPLETEALSQKVEELRIQIERDEQALLDFISSLGERE